MSEYIRTTSIPGLYIIENPIYCDNRGFFREVFRIKDLKEVLDIDFKPVQWNHSRSIPEVIRGFHAEEINKLVYLVSGRAHAVIADIREESPTFSKYEIIEISEDDPKALFISKGLANSFCAIGDKPAEYIYLVDGYYEGPGTKAIAWNDPILNVDWPVRDPIISEKDRNNPTLKDLFPHKFE